MFRLKNLLLLVLLITAFLTSCEKDAIDVPTVNTVQDQLVTETTESDSLTLTSFRALAAAAKASNRSADGPEEDNPCGCYDIFKDIDFDASDEAVEAEVEAILENLSDQEISRLFDPVCTEEGEIYESACIADCEGITAYDVCSDEQLEDYFFDDFECGDLDSLSFPFELELPDGNILTVNSEEELFDALDQWYADHDEYDEWEEGEWEEDFEECFSIIFPIDIAFPEGSIQTFNNEEELDQALEAWFDENWESDTYPMPVFPIDIQLADSTIVSIEEEGALEELEFECYGAYEDDFCFELVFPMTVNLPDGTTVLANTEEELEDILVATLGDDLEEEKEELLILTMILPFDIQLEDGTQKTITKIDDLEKIFETCFEMKDSGLGRMGKGSKLRKTLPFQTRIF